MSGSWTVTHEPDASDFARDRITEATRSLLQLASYSRFYQTSYYGEVNSLMRLLIKPTIRTNSRGHRTSKKYRDFEVDKKGVILRNPYELMLSTMNRSNPDYWDSALSNLTSDLCILDWCVSSGFYLIRFNQMTSNEEYLNCVLRDFGINDVTVTSSMVNNVINSSIKTLSLKDLSSDQFARLERISDPFIARHSL
jgi:hypothetical protein